MGILFRPDRPKFWYLRNEVTGEKIRTDIVVGDTPQARKDSKILATAAYHKLMGTTGAERHGVAKRAPIRFAAFATWYAENVIAHREGAARDLGILRRHLMKFFGRMQLHEIRASHLADYATWRKHAPTVIEHFGGPAGKRRTLKAPCHNTINRETDVLKQILAGAVPEHLEASPLVGVAKLNTTDRPIVRRRMTEPEHDRILAKLATPWDRAIWLIMAHTLARLSSVLDLKKTDHEVDPATGRHTLTFSKPKGGKPYTVPATQEIVHALEALPVTAGEYLFPQRRGGETAHTRRTGLAHAIQRAAQAAGVRWGRAKGGNTIHWGTRSSGVTRMLEQGGEGVIGAVVKMGGWANSDMVLEIYNQTHDSHLIDIVRRQDRADAEKARRARQDGPGQAIAEAVKGQAAPSKPAARRQPAKSRAPLVPRLVKRRVNAQ
jgi:integrase